ncbi:MAG: hypothetical protein KJ718_04145 [Nanoarchaeota archaeon]|nr:hypothetical protein [Nanoarchaeota archaeon]MBU1051719.1 hypothetical protein [Nanoarchaeota archaeon]MBU1988933.1 hypothetical protein [Nanoarchaeota archaeon]
MKKSVIGLVVLVFVLFFNVGFASAKQCGLNISVVNQDPYPAVPGGYVKVVFQMNGVDNPECGEVGFEIVENFPFSLDEGEPARVDIGSGTHIRNFRSFWLIPYELRIHENALDGNNPVDVVVYHDQGRTKSLSKIEQFDINIETADVDFEISIKEYETSTNTITFEILNVGENDVEALTLEIPKQDNIAVKGSNRNIIGDLDSNEDTTAKFEAIPQNGEIEVSIIYTNKIDERRMLTKRVVYDSSYFTDRKAEEIKPKSAYFYLFWVFVVLWVVLWFRKRWKRKKLKERERRRK